MTTQQVTAEQAQQVMAAAVQAMTAGVFASALGIMAASTSAVPAGIAVTDPAVADLKRAFGASIVDKAIKNVGKGDIILLAQEVERLVIAEMNKLYGAQNTAAALAAAPPGDLRTAREVARVLAGQGIKPTSSPAKVDAALNIAKKRGKQVAQPVKDTKTGIVYHSKSAAGMAVAAEYGLPATRPNGEPNTFVWYEVIKKDPKRFVPTQPSRNSKAK